LPVELGEN